MQPTVRPENPQARSLIATMRKDFQLLVFYMLPMMEEFSEEPAWLLGKSKVPAAKAERFKSDLLSAGLWIRDAGGRLRTRQDRLGMGDSGTRELKSAEFLTMSAQIFSHIAPDGPCWYEAHTVTTSHELKRQFLSRMHEVVQEFLKASEGAKGETILTWSHVVLDTLKTLERQETEE